jgi:5-(carboxyamino)imidazole ribonucleotide synthase
VDIVNTKIGILGGGQLGKMLCQAGSKLGLDLSILEKDASFPAGAICRQFFSGDITDYDDVYRFGKEMDVITIEIENVNISALEKLEQEGKKVFPQTDVLRIIKDKGLQKTFYEGNNIPTSDFSLFKDADHIRHAVVSGMITIPFVQKSRTDGYDGKGVKVVRTQADLDDLIDAPSIMEEMVDIAAEISVIIARSETGRSTYFPVAEMEFHPTANLVEFLFCPSSLTPSQQQEAIALAQSVADKLEIVGLLAVEMFLDKQGNILVNEVAPRPHNSGHHTIEACSISQYELHLRALLDLPLPEVELIRPAVMVNVLGEPGHSGPTVYQGMTDCLAHSGVHPHIYGKKDTKPFRKMGHVTIVKSTLEEAKSLAQFIKNTLKVIT